jgi:hypothetical protein
MTTSGGHDLDLDLYDVAFLAGGLPRVVETALVELVGTERVRVHSPGELVVSSPTRRHPVEAAVLDAVGTPGHRSVDTIRWRLTDDERLHAVGQRLVEAGFAHRLPWPRASRSGARTPARTRKGNAALAAATRAADPSRDPTEALLVAVSGIGAMTDPRRRSAIFERPQTSLRPAKGHRRSRDIDHSDPHLAAYRTGGTAATAGTYALFVDGTAAGAP